MAHWSYGNSQHLGPHPGGFVDPSRDSRSYRYPGDPAPTQGYAQSPPASYPSNTQSQYPGQPAAWSTHQPPAPQPTGLPSYAHVAHVPSPLTVQRANTMPEPHHQQSSFQTSYHYASAPNVTHSTMRSGAAQYTDQPLSSVPEHMDDQSGSDVPDREARYKSPPSAPLAGRQSSE
ncbi:hypothetical protein BC834DRAFT_672440 [Gloeopeniophorella convolvens]|nr:hypothetical protein BC834DRAFT_672440 [Gloeopeniophorella convolvens]